MASKMTKDDLLDKLVLFSSWKNDMAAHIQADEALLTFIDDENIARAFFGVERNY